MDKKIELIQKLLNVKNLILNPEFIYHINSKTDKNMYRLNKIFMNLPAKQANLFSSDYLCNEYMDMIKVFREYNNIDFDIEKFKNKTDSSWFNTPTLERFYKSAFDFIKRFISNYLNDEDLKNIETVCNFIEECNKDGKIYMFNCDKNLYNSFEEEVKIFLESEVPDKDQFYKIGEYLCIEELKKYNTIVNIIHTAKEVGNGLGYDIYFQLIEEIIKEIICEVKTTFFNHFEKGTDDFELTEKEYSNYLLAISGYLKFYVYRVYLQRIKDENTGILLPYYNNIILEPKVIDNRYCLAGYVETNNNQKIEIIYKEHEKNCKKFDRIPFMEDMSNILPKPKELIIPEKQKILSLN